MLKKLIILLLIFVTNSIITNAQSGFIKEKKNLYLKLDYQFYNAVNFNNLNGEDIITNEFKQKSFLLYAEYGLTDKITLSANFPLLKLNAYENTETVNGIGDLKLEFKYALSKGKFPVAVSFTPEIPIGNKNLFAKSKINSFDQINLATGDGEFNFITTIATSHSFYPKPAYINLFSSFNYRTGFNNQDFKNQLFTGFEAGYKLYDKLWFSGKISVLNTIGTAPQFADFIRGNGTTYTGLSLGSTLEIRKDYGISVQYFTPTDLIVKSRNNYEANIFSLGVVYSKKKK